MYKLLVLEDEEYIRMGLIAVIEQRCGHKVVVKGAEDGSAGIELIKSWQPDILLMDINMPIMSGIDVMNWLKVQQIFPAVIILSGFDEFEYAQNALRYGARNYLLKPVSNEELIQSIEVVAAELEAAKSLKEDMLKSKKEARRGSDLMRRDYLNRLIADKESEEDILAGDYCRFGFDISHMHYDLMVADYKKSTVLYKSTDDELERFSVINIAEEVIAEQGESGWCFYDKKGRLIILLKRSLPVQDCSLLYRTIASNLLKYLELESYAVYQECHKHFYQLHALYKNLEAALRDKILFPTGTVRRIQENYCLEQKQHPNGTISDIISQIETGNKYLVREHLDRYINTAIATEKKGEILRIRYDFLIKYLYDYFSGRGVNCFAETEPTKNFSSFDVFWSVDQLVNYLCRCCYKICDYLEADQDITLDSHLIRHVLKYIHENYNQNMNLNLIADHFGKSSSYLSVLFKKHIGENFTDYLTGIRMEKAKQYLREGKYKTNEIAAMIGYQDAKYFYKLFKKEVGLTPKQYQNRK